MHKRMEIHESCFAIETIMEGMTKAVLPNVNMKTATPNCKGEIFPLSIMKILSFGPMNNWFNNGLQQCSNRLGWRWDGKIKNYADIKDHRQ